MNLTRYSTGKDFEDIYIDVLQNIEAAIVSVFRSHPMLIDHDVMNTLDALIMHYKNTLRNLPIKTDHRLPFPNDILYAEVQHMCEIRLGRIPEFEDIDPLTAVSVDEILLCLKRIKLSVKKWNNIGGRQGYLTFVQNYVL